MNGHANVSVAVMEGREIQPAQTIASDQDNDKEKDKDKDKDKEEVLDPNTSTNPTAVLSLYPLIGFNS